MMAQAGRPAHRHSPDMTLFSRHLYRKMRPTCADDGEMHLLAAGVNHKTAELDFRERITFASEDLAAALHSLVEVRGVAQAVLLSTCNRTECYCLVEDSPDLPAWLASWHHLAPDDVRDHWYSYYDHAALRHMMRVAGGLDSMVLGEPQVLGQMRDAHAHAREIGTLGGELAEHFEQVFGVAKRIRTETDIGAHAVSVAYAAVSFARHIFADLSSNQALLIGAGETIDLAARHLRDLGVRELIIANRTRERARELAAEVGGRPITLDELPPWLPGADILISSTGSPEALLDRKMVKHALKQRRHRPMFMVDIAVPRDIAPEVGEWDDVYLYTVDDLHEAIEENIRQRREAAAVAEQLIDRALEEIQRAERERQAVDTLRSYREQVMALGDAELERALRQLNRGDNAEEVLSRFRHNLINKILHEPSVQLRRLAADDRREALELARELLLGENGYEDND
jgi:glutamyl-tRNA reductase